MRFIVCEVGLLDCTSFHSYMPK